MKRALILNGRVCDVVSVGGEFEVSPEFTWMDCGDDAAPDTHYFDGKEVVAVPDTKDARNAKRMMKLMALDAVSIRGLREFVVAKFGADALLPAFVKAAELSAQAERNGIES